VKALDFNPTKTADVPARDGSVLHSSLKAPSLSELSILAVITTAAAALRFHALGAKSFWLDEGVGVGIARLDWYNFVRILWRREANMALYYLLLRGWLHFGSSEAFIRSLSVCFGLAAIPALYLLGRRLFDSRIALTAAALLCVNSFHVYYSQEARSYTLTVFLCILSSLYFLKLFDVPSRWNRTTYVLLSSLAVYAHFFSGLVLLAHWLSLRLLDPSRVPKETRKVWVPIAVAVFPDIAFIATTGAGPLRWIPRPGLHDLWDLALDLTGSGGVLLVFLYAGACLAAILLSENKAGWRSKQVAWDEWRIRFLLLWMFLPVLLVFAVSFARPLFQARYFILSLPALLLLAAHGLASIRWRWFLTVTLLAFLGISLRGTAAYYRERSMPEEDNWRAASQYLLNNTHSGDALVFHIAMGRLPYEYYHTLPNAPSAGPVVIYPYHGPQITFLDFVEKPNYERLEREIPQHQRVWFVITRASTPSGLDRTTSALSAVIGATEPMAEQHDFGEIQIVLYSKPGSR
jgi:mannosyltransferase